MTQRVHILKTWPEPFQAVLDGRKRHEVRVDDRGFAVGDILELREYEPDYGEQWDGVSIMGRATAGKSTGRELRVRVTYLTAGGSWGLPPNLCVMSIEHVEGSP